MKKPVKLILWVLSVTAGILIIAALMFFINFLRATKQMTPAETGALNDSVWCVKDKFVNSYIFKDNNGFLIVDAGFGIKSFGNELKKLGIKPELINTILLTHTDGDHKGPGNQHSY